MLDDLRNSSSFIDEEDSQENAQAQSSTLRQDYHYRQQPETFMGMTAQQRFIISLIVFLMVFVLGIFALVVSGSIVLPL